MSREKRVFLLGGHDLEMMEIKKILSSNNIEFIDKNLSWGAKVSDYKEHLKFDGTLYGVELEADIEIPQNYVEIDHHGKNDHKPSSLEQVAELLNITLTKEQKLIAANDSRYISGMKALCATQNEIDEIRAKDRKFQGITKEDEERAKISVDASCKLNTNIIFSQTPKFSTVSDLAYFKFDKYVIYNFSKVVFYGYKKEKVLEFLESQNISKTSYYYGGGDFGFVGIKDGVLSFAKIYNLLKKFKKMENKEKLHSYHTFMLPFTFKGNFIKNENWNYEPFKINAQRDYNEFVYFYKHVQDAIYNKKEENGNKEISKYYEYKEKSGTYAINSKKGEFELQLDGISLRIFNTDVAILAFNLKNTKHSELEAILAINDFGRRIYPQFLGDKFTVDTKKSILANCITLSFDDGIQWEENFTKFDEIKNLKDLKNLNLLPSFISNLIEENFSKDKENKTTIRPIIDDRMFVISQYHNDVLIEKLKVFKYCNEYEYETNDFWYKYLFIDGDSKTCQSKHMTKKLIHESTYDRWIDEGTLFGISRYSFVSVTSSWFGENILLKHTQTMYFQMFTILLAYRATIIKFADEIQNATKDDNDQEITKESQKVYKRYLSFLNNLYFKEVTAQDQGIELYNQAMKIMDIEKYMNDLDREINELHGYVAMIEEKSRNEKLGFISKIGAVLLPPSLLAGLFGMNVLTFDSSWINETFALALVIFSGVIGFSLTVNDKEESSNINSDKKIDKFCKRIISTFKEYKSFLIAIFFVAVIIFGIFADKKDEPQDVKVINEPTVQIKDSNRR